MKNVFKLTLVLAILSLVTAWMIGGDKGDESAVGSPPVVEKTQQKIRMSAVFPIPENRDLGELLVDAYRYSPNEASRVADLFSVLSYESVHGISVTLENDAELMVIGSALLPSGRVQFGTILKSGDSLIQGFVLNIGSKEALLGAYSIKPHAALAVNFIDSKGDVPQLEIGTVPEILLAGGGSCPITCSIECDGDRFYTCCYLDSDGCAHCVCVPRGNEPPATCSAGGTGSTACSIGGSTPDP